MMKLINALFFVVCLMTNSIGHRVDGMHNVLEDDLERHLNLINKARVTSIQVYIYTHIVNLIIGNLTN
jgi:hypothetical protein